MFIFGFFFVAFSLRLLICVCVRGCPRHAVCHMPCRTLPCLWSFPFVPFVPVVHDSNGSLVFIFTVLLCIVPLLYLALFHYPLRVCLASPLHSTFPFHLLASSYLCIHPPRAPSFSFLHRVCLIICVSIHPSAFFLYSGSKQAFLVSMGSPFFHRVRRIHSMEK